MVNFIIPYRNVKQFIEICANSLLLQQNNNWKAYFCDDNSNDDTISSIPNDPRFTIFYNEDRISALPNIHYSILKAELTDDDIIAILDGDDFLISNNVVDIIENMYSDNTLLTYGQYIFPNGAIGHCKAYTKESFINLRNGGYWASHLRTFKYKLYKELINQDNNLNCYKDDNGEFYQSCYDVAIMTPLMEIAGFDNIKFNPTPVYYYRLHNNNDHMVDPALQSSVANEIFKKNSFKQIF